MLFDSEYICICGSLLYLDPQTKNEFCLTIGCRQFVNETIKTDFSQYIEAVRRKNQTLMAEAHRFPKAAFLQFLAEVRESLLFNYLNMRGLYKEEFYAVNELIRRITASPISWRARVTDRRAFEKYLAKFTDHYHMENFADDIAGYRFVMTERRTLVLKYSHVFDELLANYGFISSKGHKAGTVFKYDIIDLKKDFAAEYKQGDDLIVYYKRFWRFMVAIDYFLNYHYKQATTYAYSVGARDIAFLLSIYHSIKQGVIKFTAESLKNHLTINCEDESTHRTFRQAIVQCSNQVPIIISNQNLFLAGKFTSLYFTIYLISLHSKRIVHEGKELASVAFESTIRNGLRAKGYIVPRDEEFKITIAKASHAYDVIAVSHSLRKVLLVEVKYKDFPSSSLNGVALLNNELYNPKNGLLAFADRQNERVDFFKENLPEFIRQLGTSGIETYPVEAWIVTKYKPLINQHRDVKIAHPEKFMSSV